MQFITTNAGAAAIAAALDHPSDPNYLVNITKFSVGFTSGSVSASDTSVPSETGGKIAISSYLLVDSKQVQYECVITETFPTFTLNVLGLWGFVGTGAPPGDSSLVLYAIGKFDASYNHVTQSLPTTLGNRFNFRAHIKIDNGITAALSFTNNTINQNNLANIVTADLLPSAVSDVFKTYRVTSMPDGYSDLAFTNGTNWSFARYFPERSGTTTALSSASNKIRGDSTHKWLSTDVGKIIEITSGADTGKVRIITSVDKPNNEATVNSGYSAAIASGVTFRVHSKAALHLLGLTPPLHVPSDNPGAPSTANIREQSALRLGGNTQNAGNIFLGSNAGSNWFWYQVGKWDLANEVLLPSYALVLQPLGGAVVIGTSYITGLSDGELCLANNKWLRANNQALSSQVNVLRVNTSNQIEFGTTLLNSVIQEVFTEFTTYGSTNLAIPADDTIPQSSEGAEVFTATITPKLTSSRLEIELQVQLSQNINETDAPIWTLALFKDSEDDARAAVIAGLHASLLNNHPRFISPLRLVYNFLSPGTSPITFKARVGVNGIGTVHWNGLNSARLFGGVCMSYMKITEYRHL